eukprot:CAMPEP_0201285642 /NCGR_PEP_ID=MMETSP1317-20130820/113613_1 /ASSEMBLY_ACC=CAM_ASM_000770 /TAXON_ID=187299 /ORGANISM="Undescribed Undescribed, Strain Undescribed" /LENGTH=117 /DNA_ID=CAMNT_0047611315 /DNA_START=2047 /DNA_END=2400 /DNA_ORIENTATION=-
MEYEEDYEFTLKDLTELLGTEIDDAPYWAIFPVISPIPDDESLLVSTYITCTVSFKDSDEGLSLKLYGNLYTEDLSDADDTRTFLHTYSGDDTSNSYCYYEEALDDSELYEAGESVS